MDTYKVLNNITIYYGSTTRNSETHYRIFHKGDILKYQSSAPNGNVWFYDLDGERGKNEAGHISNLIKRGILEKAD